MKLSLTVPVELEFVITADFTPGRPATPPSYASAGDPPDAAEWNIDKIDKILFQNQDILTAISPDSRKAVCAILSDAICLSPKLDEHFAEAINEEAANASY